MDKAFVVTGTMETERGTTKVGGIFFTNQTPEYAQLAELGFQDASIHHAKPLSPQPTQPTLYYFDRSSHTKMVDVISFDWQGAVVNQVRVQGAPNKMVPPVSGENVDDVLYAPCAFLIKGCMDMPRMTPVLAVLVVKPEPGKECLKPEVKTLKKMGFTRINSVEEVGLSSNKISEDALFVVERSPAATGILVAALDKRGKITSEKTLSGDPLQLLPPVTGPAVEQLFRNGLKPSVAPPRESKPPSKRKARR